MEVLRQAVGSKRKLYGVEITSVPTLFCTIDKDGSVRRHTIIAFVTEAVAEVVGALGRRAGVPGARGGGGIGARAPSAGPPPPPLPPPGPSEPEGVRVCRRVYISASPTAYL